MKRLGLWKAILLLICLPLEIAGLRASAEESSSPAEVRVTTGCYRIAGWEKELIKGNPNLARYTWMPVTGYIQGKAKLKQPTGPNMDLSWQKRSPGKPIYIRPIHLSTVAAKKEANSPETNIRGLIRVPSNRQVSAKLAYGKDDKEVSAKVNSTPTVLVYPKAYGAMGGMSDDVSGLLEHKQVYGRINNRGF